MSIQLGSPIVLVNVRDGFDQTYGRYFDYIYEGNETSCLQLAATFRSTARQTVVSGQSRKKKQLLVRLDYDPSDPGGPNEIRVEFRLQQNRILKDILDSEISETVSEDDKRIIRENIQNPIEGAGPALTPDSDAHKMYLLMLEGVRSVVVTQAVLFMVRSASSTYDWVARPNNVGNIYSETQMLSEIDSLTGLQPSFYRALPSLTTARTRVAYGWLKHAPTYDQVAGGHTSETTEWEYGLWSTDLYEAAT